MPLSLLSDAYAIYACDPFGDDSDGNYIWDRSLSSLDLTKGDGSTSSTFPTFTTDADYDTSFYAFDGVDDYLSGWSIPSGYWISAVFSTAYPDGQPYVTQVTDDTIKSLLTVSGAFTGNLHNMVVFATEPTTAEKAEIADYQTRRLWSEQHADPYVARLIRNEDCVLWLDFEHPEDMYHDYSGVTATVTPTNCEWDDGLKFDTGGKLTVPDQSDLRLTEMTLFVSTLDNPGGDYIDKTGNYTMGLSAFNRVYFDSHFFANGPTASGFHSIALTATNTNRVLYWDGAEYDTDSGAISFTGTADIEIGAGPSNYTRFYRVGIFNRVLTAQEIKILHYSALLGNDTAGDLLRGHIFDIDGDDEVDEAQTNVICNCVNAGSTEGKLLFTDSDVYAESTVVVEQSIDSWSDSSIQFDVVLGGL